MDYTLLTGVHQKQENMASNRESKKSFSLFTCSRHASQLLLEGNVLKTTCSEFLSNTVKKINNIPAVSNESIYFAVFIILQEEEKTTGAWF